MSPHCRSRVLLVEDDAAIREMTCDILKDDGFEVVPTADAEAALHRLQCDGPFDLLFSDIGLPGMNGRELAERATTLDPAMPILLMTGYAGVAGARPTLCGVRLMLIHKPFTLQQLLRSVHALL